MKLVEHRSELVAYARTMVGDYAEDVVSDLSEYFIRGRFNAPDRYLPLLKWYVKRRCIDHIRQCIPMQELPRSLQITIEESMNDPRIDYIETALTKLHPVVSGVIILNRVERVTLPEISKHTGISVGRLRYIKDRGEEIIRDNAKSSKGR